jgi:tRNA threonylcarbamoyladenosine biosynthesis protein TsaE
VTLERTGTVRQIRCADSAATEALGAALGKSMRGAALESPDRALIVFLRGPLGSGKTTLVRGWLRALGVHGSIRSPTFSLLEHYPLDTLNLLHIDLYRLDSPRDLAGLGLADFDHAGALWLIEWPEQAEAALPPPDLELQLSIAAQGHDVQLAAQGDLGEAWLERLDRQLAST